MAVLYVADDYIIDDYVQSDISIDWGNKIIFVPVFYMSVIQQLPSYIYELNINDFRLTLKDLEDSSDGMAFERTHRHNASVEVGGIFLARVIEMLNGYTLEFEELDYPYRVNLIGANSNIGEKVNLGSGKVSISTTNSAGLQDLDSLQSTSFSGEVVVDTVNGYIGTIYPTGTRQKPVNNMQDAILIANHRGITTFKLKNSIVLENLDFSSGYTFISDAINLVLVTVLPSASLSFCTFLRIGIGGVLDNNNMIRECTVFDLVNLNGQIFLSALAGTITLGGGVTASILSCFSGATSEATRPRIDMGGGGQSLIVRDYSGGIEIINKTSSDGCSLDMAAGEVFVRSSVTDGKVTVRGVCEVIDESTASAVVDVSGVLNNVSIAEEVNALTLSQFVAMG